MINRIINAFKSRSIEQSPNDAVLRLLTSLKGIGLTPKHIVDIGANHGGWSRTALSVFPQARLSIFEPQKALAGYLLDLMRSPNVEIHHKGVGDIDGILPFTFHERDDSSSFIYNAEEAEERGFNQTEIAVCRLDTALADCRFGPPDIIKIDAEGFDLRVLDGAIETLRTSEIVLIEASIANRDYPNSILAVIRKMDDLGFRLFDFTDLNRTPRRKILWLVEAVFVRKDSATDLASARFD